MSNEGKTREQLLAEIAALQAELERLSPGATGQPKSASEDKPAPAGVTRRDSLVGWVGPVILSMPVVQGLAMVAKPGVAHAAMTKSPTARPTRVPSATPTAPSKKTSAPTVAAGAPTNAPTSAPTRSPTASPTNVGNCPAPTVAPTLGMAAAPDTAPVVAGAAGFLPLGSARQKVAVSLRVSLAA